MSSITCLLLIITSVALLPAEPSGAAAYTPTAYDILQLYFYPVGLLPKGVRGYELNVTTGQFTVYLNQICSFTVYGYDLKFDKRITGTISPSKIENLEGVQVKVLFFFWVNIVEVINKLLDHELEFSVGLLSDSFPVDNFNESPQCGCGFDCVNAVVGKRSGKFSYENIVPLLHYM